MRKQYIIVILIIAICLSFTGCKDEESIVQPSKINEPGGQQGPDTNDPTPEPTTPNPGAGSGNPLSAADMPEGTIVRNPTVNVDPNDEWKSSKRRAIHFSPTKDRGYKIEDLDEMYAQFWDGKALKLGAFFKFLGYKEHETWDYYYETDTYTVFFHYYDYLVTVYFENKVGEQQMYYYGILSKLDGSIPALNTERGPMVSGAFQLAIEDLPNFCEIANKARFTQDPFYGYLYEVQYYVFEPDTKMVEVLPKGGTKMVDETRLVFKISSSFKEGDNMEDVRYFMPTWYGIYD